MANQRKRTSKTSKGINGGGGKVKLTRLQQYLLGKGPTAAAERKMYRDSFKAKK